MRESGDIGGRQDPFLLLFHCLPFTGPVSVRSAIGLSVPEAACGTLELKADAYERGRVEGGGTRGKTGPDGHRGPPPFP